VNVTTGMVVKKGNDYYYYNSLDSRDLNLATENYSNGYWLRNPSLTQEQRDDALSWDFGTFAADKVGSMYYVLKTADIAQPTLRYGSQQNIISEQIRTLTVMQAQHASDAQAVARYQANIAALKQQLQSIQMTTVVNGQIRYLDSFSTFYIDVPDMYASGGSVYISATDVTGVKTAGIDARANTQINIVNDSPMLMNVNDAVVMDGTIIRPGSDGQLKVFKTGHLYINDVSVKGASGSDLAEVNISQIRNTWATDPFGGALDSEVAGMLKNAPVDLSLLGSVVNPLGKVSVINTLGSINVSGTIQAVSLDIVAKGNFSLQSEGWFNTGSDPTLLNDSWSNVILALKNGGKSTGISDTMQNVLLAWNSTKLDPFTQYLNNNSAARDSRIFALGAVNISALTLNIDGKIQSGLTDAYIRIDSSFRGDQDKALQDYNGYAVTGVAFSADGSMNRYGAITGRFDYATQTIILDPIRLAGGSISLTGQIVSVGNGNLIVANGYASVHIDNQTTYALVTHDIDVSTYRRGRIEIIDTARGQRDLYELQGVDNVVHTVWNKFVQVTPTSVGQPDWIWVYEDAGTARTTAGKALESGTLAAGQTLNFSYKPQAGQTMVWVMGWSSGETTTTTYTTKRFNLFGDWDPLGWLTDKNTTKSGPVTVYETPRPVLVSTVVAYNGAGSVPDTLKDQLNAGGKLNDALLPTTIEGSGTQTLVEDVNGSIVAPDGTRYSLSTTGGETLDPNVFTVAYRKFNTGVLVRNDGPHTSGGGWLRTKTTTLTQVVEKKQQELFTFYVPASQQITLSFMGSSVNENAIYIRSNGNVTLAGNLIVGNGKQVHIEAVSASKPTSITMQGEVGIMARDPDGKMPSGAGAQVNVEAIALGGAINLNIMGSNGFTRAEARNDIRLSYFSDGGNSSWATLQKVASSSGTVYIEALNGIFTHASAGSDTVVSGNRIELNAGYGAIGTASQALTVHARQGFAAQAGLAGGPAGADKSIYLAQNVLNADLVLVKPVNWSNPQASVFAEMGSVNITLNGGSLLDGELADTRTATEKAYPTVTAKILADLSAQLAQYDSYWSGVRSLQTATITLGGVGTFLSTQAEGGQYLAISMTAAQYASALKAAVEDHRLVRLAYNNSLNGNARTEILGYLTPGADFGVGGVYRFSFSVYDPLTGLTAAPASLAALGYTAGSQGVLYGPAYALATGTDVSNANLPITFTLPSGTLNMQQGSDTLRLSLTTAMLEQLTGLSFGNDFYAQALAKLRTFTYIKVGNQQLLIDQILPTQTNTNGNWWGTPSFDTILITLKSPYVGDLTVTDATGHHNLNIVLGNAAGEAGAGSYTGTANTVAPQVPASGQAVGSLPAGDVDITSTIISAIDQYNLANPSAMIPVGPGSLYQNLVGSPTPPASAWSVVERTVTSNKVSLSAAQLNLNVPGNITTVQGYNDWMNAAINGLVGSMITFTVDGVEYTRRVESLNLVLADGSPATSLNGGGQRYVSVQFDGAAIAQKNYYVRNAANVVQSVTLPTQLKYGLTGLGQATATGAPTIAYSLARGFGAIALKQGVLTADQPQSYFWGWGGSNVLPFHTYTETQTGGATNYAQYVDIGNGFSWDLSTAAMSDTARAQLANSIKALLKAGQSISLAGLDLYMTNQNGSLQGHDLGVYD
ncbi:MAG: hypothetical protein ACREX5_18835, partial [Achromobacter pestifer]